MISFCSKLVLAFGCLAMFLATAQTADGQDLSIFIEPQQVDAQRLVINAKRQQLQSGFKAEDDACYQRFAVNNCLRDVNARRMASLADLQRQDVFLNDQERKRRGAEEISRIEAKQTAANQQELAERRAKVFAEYEMRTQVIDQRQRLKTSEADAAAIALQATSNRLKAAKAKADARQQQQAGASQEAVKFQERQVQAEKRRAEHAQQQAAKPIGAAKGLPVPP